MPKVSYYIYVAAVKGRYGTKKRKVTIRPPYALFLTFYF